MKRALRGLSLVVTSVFLGVGIQGGTTAGRPAPEIAPPPAHRPADPGSRVLVVYDREDPNSVGCKDHTVRVLEYGKTPHVAWDMQSRAPLPPLEDFGTVAVVTGRIQQLGAGEANRVVDFVSRGGGLAMLVPGWHPMLGKVFRRPAIFLPEIRQSTPGDTIALHGLLMPGAEGLRLSGPYGWLDLSSSELTTDGEVRVLASTADGARPVAWTNPYHRGHALYWNANVLCGTSARGLIAQSLVAVRDLSIRPLANWGVIYLDDFPSPASSVRLEPIATEFGQGMAEFYANRWYPDMRRIAARFGLTYTSALVFSYNGSTAPPYRFDEWLAGIVRRDRRAVYYSPWMSRRNARFSEVGFHGYNHEPLTLRNWRSESNMVRALERARWRWEADGIGSFPEIYVPPMNVIDSVGVQALARVFPSVKVIAGSNYGLHEEGQGREFGPEPWNTSLYAFPRNTSGYVLTDGMKLDMLSLLHVVGGWGHFIHPDDVFPNEHRTKLLRNDGVPLTADQLRWHGTRENEGLLPRFERWLRFTRDHYPWIRYMSASRAADEMKAHQAAAFSSTRTADGIRVDLDENEGFFAVYSRRGERVVDVSGGEVIHRGRTPLFTYHVLRSDGRTVHLRLTDEP